MTQAAQIGTALLRAPDLPALDLGPTCGEHLIHQYVGNLFPSISEYFDIFGLNRPGPPSSSVTLEPFQLRVAAPLGALLGDSPQDFTLTQDQICSFFRRHLHRHWGSPGGFVFVTENEGSTYFVDVLTSGDKLGRVEVRQNHHECGCAYAPEEDFLVVLPQQLEVAG